MFLRIAYSDSKLLKRSPVTVLLSPAALCFPPKLLLNIVTECLVLKTNVASLVLMLV